MLIALKWLKEAKTVSTVLRKSFYNVEQGNVVTITESNNKLMLAL